MSKVLAGILIVLKDSSRIVQDLSRIVIVFKDLSGIFVIKTLTAALFGTLNAALPKTLKRIVTAQTVSGRFSSWGGSSSSSRHP